MTAILGLDLSTRAAAMVAVPLSWGGDWSRVDTNCVGLALGKLATEEERAMRNAEIAREIVLFANRNEVREAWIEGYAFGLAGSAFASLLMELCGVVKLELARSRVAIRIVMASSARKLLLGKNPTSRGGVRVNAKKLVREALQAAGGDFATDDECDAFACANAGLSLAGAFFYTVAVPEKKRR